jgi:hypothetical protein
MGEGLREEHAAHLTPFLFARKITPALEKFFTTESMESMGMNQIHAFAVVG